VTANKPTEDELDLDDPGYEWMHSYRCTGMVDCSDVSEIDDPIP
jgi:hypothetical protein